MGGEASSCNTLHWPHFPVFDSVIKILADKQTSQTDQHLKCDARVRDFCLRTVDSINRNLSVRLPLILPQLHLPQLPKAVSLPHRLLVKHLRSPPPPPHPSTLSDGGNGGASLPSQQWMTNLKGSVPGESLWRKDTKTCSEPMITSFEDREQLIHSNVRELQLVECLLTLVQWRIVSGSFCCTQCCAYWHILFVSLSISCHFILHCNCLLFWQLFIKPL